MAFACASENSLAVVFFTVGVDVPVSATEGEFGSWRPALEVSDERPFLDCYSLEKRLPAGVFVG